MPAALACRATSSASMARRAVGVLMDMNVDRALETDGIVLRRRRYRQQCECGCEEQGDGVFHLHFTGLVTGPTWPVYLGPLTWITKPSGSLNLKLSSSPREPAVSDRPAAFTLARMAAASQPSRAKSKWSSAATSGFCSMPKKPSPTDRMWMVSDCCASFMPKNC